MTSPSTQPNLPDEESHATIVPGETWCVDGESSAARYDCRSIRIELDETKKNADGVTTVRPGLWRNSVSGTKGWVDDIKVQFPHPFRGLTDTCGQWIVCVSCIKCAG
jgi:hypothetical protein